MDPYPRSPSPDVLTMKFLRGSAPPKRFHSISDILKPSNSPEPPSFLLEEAKFYLQGDPNLAPASILLEARPGSKLVVEGQFIADKDQLNLLRKDGSGNQKNNALVRAFNVDAYSIGDDPVTIWVASDNIWLEVRPHVDYLRKYDESTLAVKLYYGAIDFYKKMKTLKVPPNSFNEPFEIIHEYLQCYSGAGITLRDVAALLNSNRKFFHNMVQAELGGQGNKFFTWIAAGAPLSPIDGIPISPVSQKFAAILTDSERYDLTAKYYQLTAPCIPPPSLPPPPIASPSPPPIVDTSNRISSSSTAACDWKSTRFPQGITPEDRFPIASFGLLCYIILSHCSESGKRAISEHTVPYLHDRLYYGFGVTWRPVARELIRRCSAQIVSALDEQWATSPLVKDLITGAPSQMPSDQKYAVELEKILSGEKSIGMRTPKTTASTSAPAPRAAPRTARFARSSTPATSSVVNMSPVPATLPVPVVKNLNIANRSENLILTPRNETAVKSSGYGRLLFEPFGL